VIDSISFLYAQWVWPVILVTGLLWLVFLWKEFAKQHKKRWFFKSVIGLLAVTSLAVIFLKPAKLVEQTKGVGVVLTENFKQSQLDSLRSEYKDIVAIDYATNGLRQQQLDSISSAYILGNGIAPYDFWQLENIHTTYVQSDTIKGVVRVNYTQELTVGDSLVLKGLYANPIEGTKLLLEDSGGNALDSITVQDSEKILFDLHTKTKVAGQFVYHLIEKDSSQKVLTKNPMPLRIQPERRLRILIDNTFPTFETKYLKNFLSEKGHEILVRSQITKNTYKFENINRSKGTIYGFTRSNLSNFDLVIMDGQSYQALRGSSRRALNNQIEDSGLGLFIQPDDSVINEGVPFGFRLKRNEKKGTQIAPWNKVTIPVYSTSIRQETLLQPVFKAQGAIWSAYIQKGLGRVSTSLFKDTYQLVLNGNREMYEHIWSTTLSVVSQKEVAASQLIPQKEWVYKNEPFSFKVRTAVGRPQLVSHTGNAVALRQHQHIKDQWEGTTYPRNNGWNYVQLKNDSIKMPYFVFSGNDWQSKKAFKLKKANQLKFTGTKNAQTPEKVLHPYSRVWFFILFLFCMATLWTLPRIE